MGADRGGGGDAGLSRATVRPACGWRSRGSCRLGRQRPAAQAPSVVRRLSGGCAFLLASLAEAPSGRGGSFGAQRDAPGVQVHRLVFRFSFR